MKDKLLRPTKLWSRDEVLWRPSPVPKRAGVYAWYFRKVPLDVPTEGCITIDGLTLLYVGISPKDLPANGAAPSKQTLFHRIRYHYQGNAEGSTLRLTLGCLLSREIGINLRRVGSGHRLTFADGEKVLSDWMRQNAFVTWIEHPRPSVLEEQLIAETSLPLNLDKNKHHVFYKILTELRRTAKEEARCSPVWLPSVPQG